MNMSQFEIKKDLNPNKVFILNQSEIERRFDPLYYIPEISNLEKEVKKHDTQPLREYIDRISSGATPNTSEPEKYYSNKSNGIPFLRVQNLSPTGVLDYDDCKYINYSTHRKMLKRSQVKGGDLLIKITGVGRMAVASVAPEEFEGNTNQHMVVVKTGSIKKSKILAAYLNSDIGERLASRRATGGTRPALDYPALLSIPIIYSEKIEKIFRNAIQIKQNKEQQAKELLAGIDDYLLGELGITLPENNDTLESRMFTTSLSEVSERRHDCDYYFGYYSDLETSILQSKYLIQSLASVVTNIAGGKTPASNDYSDETSNYPIIKAGSYSDDYINLNKQGYTYIENKLEAHRGDIFILSAAHQAEYVGRQIKYLNIEPKLPTSYVGELICVRADKAKCNSMFLFSLLNTEIFKTLINREKTGQTSHIYGKDIKKIEIPIPPLTIQNQIADNINNIRQQAKQLQSEATIVLEQAKQEVELMILGE